MRLSSLLGITEQGNPSQYPVIRVLHRLEQQWKYVGPIGPDGLLIHRALIERRALPAVRVDGEHMHHGQQCVQYFGRGLDETGSAPVPARTVQV